MRKRFIGLFGGAIMLSALALGDTMIISITEAGGGHVFYTINKNPFNLSLTNNLDKSGKPKTSDPSPNNAVWPHLPGNPPVLVFTNFAPADVDGDVVLTPPGRDKDAGNSDLIRFFEGNIVFYSEKDEKVGDNAADLGVPNPHAGSKSLSETVFPANPGEDGATYKPMPTDPGYFTVTIGKTVFTPEYTFVSDTPEPATWVFTVTGLIALFVVRRKRSYAR